MPTTAAAAIAEPTATPATKALLCCEEIAEAVGELEPDAVETPDGGIIVTIVGCKVIVKIL